MRSFVRGPRRQLVTRIRQSSKQQSAGRYSFVLVRAERTDSKDLDGRRNAIRKGGRAPGVIEDPGVQKCRNIAILSQAAEDRHISRGDLAVEQKLVPRRKEPADTSNHPLFVIAEFPVIGERISTSEPLKTQTGLSRRVKNDFRRGFASVTDDLDVTDHLEVTGGQEILNASLQELLIQPIQNWPATFFGHLWNHKG